MSASAMTPAEIAQWRQQHPQLFSSGLRYRTLVYGAWLLFFALVLFALWRVDASPVRIWNGLDKLGFLVRLMIPPSPGGELPEYLYALAETLAMAFLGTLFAALFALPLGFMAAKNAMPNWLVRFLCRRFSDSVRGIDTLIFALIFVAAVGMGPFAGILAIIIGDLGMFMKLFSEAIENADNKPVEGVKSSGAGHLMRMRFGILPQVLPIMLSHVLYFFESNTRSAAILGMVGAGGIGLQLSEAMRGNNWDNAAFIICMILVMVAIIDFMSKKIRSKIIGQQAYRP